MVDSGSYRTLKASHSIRWLAAAVFVSAAMQSPLCAQTPLSDWLGAPGAAKFLTVQGNVSILKDTQAWAANVGGWVQPRQEIVTGHDGYATLQVSDGSRFEVFPNSRVTFRDNTGNFRDLLDLWIGRVKVHIEKLGGQPNHNRVRTPTAVISVRGTVFDVEVDPEDDVTLVYVDEGSVAVQHSLLPYSEAKILNKGEYLRVYKNAPLAQKRVDKGQVVQRALQAVSDFVVFRGPRLGGGTSAPGGIPGGGLPGDTPAPAPPPPPPPPAGK